MRLPLQHVFSLGLFHSLMGINYFLIIQVQKMKKGIFIFYIVNVDLLRTNVIFLHLFNGILYK